MLKKFRPDLGRLSSKYKLDYWLVFLLAFLFLGWLQMSPTLPEPDSFYHAKITQFLSQGEILTEFPWLQETGLKTEFVDHHFLYHLLLIPFVLIFANPLIGVKIATVLFSSLFVLVFYFILKIHYLKYPIMYVLALLLTGPWLFRASLVKAPTAFFILALLAFYFLTHQKFKSLFIISFLSVWLYGGWPILAGMMVIYQSVVLISARLKQNSKTKNVKKIFWQSLCYGFGGLMAGLVINPYFPANLNFYWQQIIEIAVINYQTIIGVGGEWYPYGFINLLTENALAMALLIIGFLYFIITYKKQNNFSWSWLILCLCFFVLTLKSRRNIEFFIPSALIFSAFSLNQFFKADLKKIIKKSIFGQQIFLAIVLGLLTGGLLLASVQEVLATKNDIKNGWSLDHYQAAATWLKENAKSGQIVFNADWDDFPFLFYFNADNYYLTGLDPTFMYKQNQAKYWQYVDITNGKVFENLADILKNEFKVDYLFLDVYHQKLNVFFKNNDRFKKKYEDQETIIYEILKNNVEIN